VKTVTVDHAWRDDADRDPRRTACNRTKKSLALGGRHLLGVVQKPERADTMVAQAFIVEEDRRGDERARETPSTRLVGAREKADPDASVEGEELSSGTAHHRGGG
jgi:hypothetical protein